MTDFAILSDREHVLLRAGMYIGSTQPEEYETFVSGKWVTQKYSQGLLKIVNEVIDNSVDEYIRTGGKYADEIKITIKGKKCKVEDNGRGIPQDEIITPEGKSILRPVAAWTKTRAGSNFDDSTRIGAGTNGVGAALTNFFSKTFKGVTCDGNKQFTLSCRDNATKMADTSKNFSKRGTCVEFEPDFIRFESVEFDEAAIDVLRSRIELLQVCYPGITFKFNGKRIQANTIKKYAKLFGETSISFTDPKFSWFLTSSPEHTFRNVAAVNGLYNSNGGAHVSWFMNTLCKELVPLIKRKFKVEVPTSAIKNGMILGIFLQDFNSPEFDSQTKERFKSSEGKVRDHCGELIDFNKIAKHILRTEDIIKPIVDVYLARKEAADLRAAAKKAKEGKRIKRVDGHIKAAKEGGEFYIAEGLSAIGYLMKVRDKNKHGGYPLRGKVKNIHNAPIKDILSNKEYVNIMACLGLDLSVNTACKEESSTWYTTSKGIILNANDELFYNNEWVTAVNAPDIGLAYDVNKKKYESQSNTLVRRQTDMYYGEIHILTDADVDGIGSIGPGVLNFFWRWPDLFKNGRVKIVRTPIIIANKTTKSKDQWYYDLEDYRASGIKFSKVRYIKGLGSLTEKEYKACITSSPRYVISVNNATQFDLLYSKGKTVVNGEQTSWEDQRKAWLLS